MDLHVKAIADVIRDGASPERPWHVEGEQNLEWMLLDFVDVVVHIFRSDARRHYRFEQLWADAPMEIVAAPEPSPLQAQ